MKSIRDIPVGKKLALMLAITITAALALILGAFDLYDHFTSRQDLLEHLATIGRMIASNSTAAVAFRDTDAATEVVATLREKPNIRLGCTYDVSGKLIAQYQHASQRGCPVRLPGESGSTLATDRATHVQPILLNNAIAGYIYVESDLSELRMRRSRFAIIAVIFLLVSLAVGTIVGMSLRRWFTAPINELVSLMDRICDKRDFSVRATWHSGDEFGRLVEGFNHMLGEVELNHNKLEHQALSDELTGLPNRRLFADRLNQAMAAARRHGGGVGVLYVDLDGFKLINDTLGHAVGDVLLRQVAGRLCARIRETDTLARIGGDEFTVIATNVRGLEDAQVVGRDVLAEFARPFRIDQHDLALTASIGISMFPDNALDAEQLLQQADTAMYAAKNSGKNKLMLYSPEFGNSVRERLELKNELSHALERNELEVQYQPEYDVVTHQLVRFEALARWKHETLGMIPPLKFIPIAEESGLIVPIGKWILERACRDAVRWQAMVNQPIQVAVNISVVQLLRDDFAEIVAGTLARTGLAPRLLQLELTDSVMPPGFADSRARMAALQSLGVTLAVDDFGTGYPSLSCLQRLPFDALKIHRSFLTKISESGEADRMMHSLVELARNLKMTIVVEGIETQGQLDLIRTAGCDQVQGYLLGRPTSDPKVYLDQQTNGAFRTDEMENQRSMNACPAPAKA